jgi:Tc toxin complex TcA C-terminal TcB-binding domain
VAGGGITLFRALSLKQVETSCWLQIATCTRQDDTGLFDTNLRDDRYLPFEASSAISEWHIQLHRVFREFDYDSIS